MYYYFFNLLAGCLSFGWSRVYCIHMLYSEHLINVLSKATVFSVMLLCQRNGLREGWTTQLPPISAGKTMRFTILFIDFHWKGIWHLSQSFLKSNPNLNPNPNASLKSEENFFKESNLKTFMDLTVLSCPRIKSEARIQRQEQFSSYNSVILKEYCPHPWEQEKKQGWDKITLNFLAHFFHSYSMLRMSHRNPLRFTLTGNCILKYRTWIYCERQHPLICSYTLFVYLYVPDYIFPSWMKGKALQMPRNNWSSDCSCNSSDPFSKLFHTFSIYRFLNHMAQNRIL